MDDASRRERNRKYYQENKERILDIRRSYYQTNKEMMLADKREWYVSIGRDQYLCNREDRISASKKWRAERRYANTRTKYIKDNNNENNTEENL